MSSSPPFEAFWTARNGGYEIAVNRWTTSHAAAVTAFLSARLGLTPNHVTMMSFACGVLGFLLAFGLPAEHPGPAILVIVILAELTFILDCADGLLARVTGRATASGDLIDHTLDVASQSCALGAVFVYAYRAGLVLPSPDLAHAALIVGFLFLVARSTRHTAIHLSDRRLDRSASATPPKGQSLGHLMTNLLEYQASIVAMLAYLLSPAACLVLFAAQTLFCIAAVARRLVRVANRDRA